MINDTKLLYDGWTKISAVPYKGKNYEKLHAYSAVGIIPYSTTNDSICIVKQYRPAVGRSTWEIPAGCIDIEGETPIEVARRELFEELNLETDEQLKVANEKLMIDLDYDIKIGKIFPLCNPYNMMIGLADATMQLFVAEMDLKYKLKYIKAFVPTEEIEDIKWVTIEEWGNMINFGEMTDAKSIMAYMHFTRDIKNIRRIIG